MLLKCECVNSSADVLYGHGIRPHSALVPFLDRPGTQPRGTLKSKQEYACNLCSYVRTLTLGKETGLKLGVR